MKFLKLLSLTDLLYRRTKPIKNKAGSSIDNVMSIISVILFYSYRLIPVVIHVPVSRSLTV